MKSLSKITLFSLLTIFTLTSSIAQSKGDKLSNKNKQKFY